MEEIQIKDYYENLKFKTVTNVNQLQVGMMVQIVEMSNLNMEWEWIELTHQNIRGITGFNYRLKWIRIPNY